MQPKSARQNGQPVNPLQLGKAKTTLTKNQQAFNRLTNRIAKLKKEVENTGARLSTLSGLYAAEITPVIEELGREKIALAKALAAGYNTVQLTAKQKGEVEEIILDLLDDAFTVAGPDKDEEALYNRFSEKPYQELLKEEEAEMAAMFRDQMKEAFGADINPEEYSDSPEDFVRLKEKMAEQLKAEKEHRQSRKKTKKQTEREAKELEIEGAKKKSLRSIYMSLVKLLHPDLEMNGEAKAAKEEVMKKVTRAYNENDLTTLLHLELEWVARETGHLETLTDEKLLVYISVLKEQIQELQMEKAALLHNPSYSAFFHLAGVNELAAAAAIKGEKRDRLSFITEVKWHIKQLQGTKLRSAIRDCIEAFAHINEQAAGADFLLDELVELMAQRPKSRPKF